MRYQRTMKSCAALLITLAVAFLSVGCGGKKEPTQAGTAAASPATLNSQLPPEPADSADVVNGSDSKPTKSSALSVAAATIDPAHKLELIATIQNPVVDGVVTEIVVGRDCLAFGPDHTFVTASPLAIWKVEHAKPVWKSDGFGDFTKMAFSPDGSILALNDRNGRVSLWDVKAEEEKHELPVGENGAWSLSFSNDGKLLVTGGFDSQIKLWDVATGAKVRSIPVPPDRLGAGLQVALSPDGKTLVSASINDLTVRLWDVGTGQAKGELNANENEPRLVGARGVTFSPDGKLVATADATAELQFGVMLWTVETRKLQAVLPQESMVESVAFSPNGELLASRPFGESKVSIWRVADQKLAQTLEPKAQSVERVAWSPDGKYFAAVGVGEDGLGVIWLWQIGPIETKKGEQSTTEPRAATPARISATSPATPEPAADSPTKPATLDQIVQAADLSKLPRLEGATGQNLKPYRLSYSASSTLDAAAQWHRKELTALGWTEAKQSIPGLDADKIVVVFFEKAGFGLALTIATGDMPSIVNVYLSHQGNVDPRQLPRPAQVQITSESRTMVTYTTAAEPDDVAAFCSKEFLALGWTDDPDPLAEFHKKQGRTILGFAANAMSLTAVIVPEKGKTIVTYFPSVSGHAVEQLQLRAKQTVDSPKPATLEQTIRVIDFRKFPRPEEAQIISSRSDNLTFETPGDFEETVRLYREKLSEQGWKESDSSNHRLERNTIQYFVKDGFFAYLQVSQGKPEGRVSVSLNNDGNVDVRQFPLVPDSRILGNAEHSIINYTTTATREKAAEFYRAELTERGWNELTGSGGSSSNEHGTVLKFMQNAIRLTIEIGAGSDEKMHLSVRSSIEGTPEVARKPESKPKDAANEPETELAGTQPLVQDLPIPKDATDVEYNKLVEMIDFQSPSNVKTVANQLSKTLEQQKWTETGSDLITDASAILSRANGKSSLTIVVSAFESGSKTKIMTKGLAWTDKVPDNKATTASKPDQRGPAKERTAPATQLAQADAKKSQAKDQTTKPQASPARSGETLVRDIPIPDGATDITYMKRRGDVRFQVTSDFKTLGNFYAKQLGEQRWTKSEKDNLQRNFWVQTFGKDKLSLEVRVDSRDGGSEVRLTPKGLMWDEDDQPRPKDLPIPKDATDVEYVDFFQWIKFKSPSNVKTVADFLSKELAEKKWTKTKTSFDTEALVMVDFTHGKSSLTIDVRSDDTGSTVTISTEGMNWDGIKEANEAAKKSATKIAVNAPSKTKPVDEPAPQPKRKDKPKQGIDKLPKLPSEGTVVMDGKTFKLTSVIAYEVFSRGEWRTKIIATQKPIKQAALLAKLKKTGKGEDGQQVEQEGEGLNVPQPFLLVELDEEDRPTRLNLQAGTTPGDGSGDELSGTALVEDGRARGTVKLKEPGEFFDKVYTAEISFDVPVLTRDSAPAKRLTDAPKLANSGTLTLGNKTYKLPNVVAYEMKHFDDPVTAIVLSEKPLNMDKLKAAVGKKSIDDYFEFTPQVKLIVDAEDNLNSIFIWADNVSVGGNDDLAGDVVIEDGRARGTAKLTKPGEFFDKKYTFELSFDVDVLGKPASLAKPSAAAVGGLVADSYDGLPIPEGYQDLQKQGSKFRTQINAKVAAELNAVVDFYRRELPSGEWKENTAAAKIEKDTATLAFTGPTGSLTVQLKAEDKQTAITLVSRDAKAAQAAGLLPAPGKARLLIANGSEKAAIITVNKRDYNVAAGAGAKDPKTGLNWDVAPGKYTVEIKLAGEEVQTEKLTIGADETWGVIIAPTGGYLAVQLY